MSEYNAKRLGVYGGSGVLLTCGILMCIVAGRVFASAPDDRVTAGVLACAVGLVYIVAATLVLRNGLRQLASDHWHAYDFRS